MSELNPQRRRVVALCAAIACMSGGPVVLRGHPVLLTGWLAFMVVALVYAIVQLVKLKRQGL